MRAGPRRRASAQDLWIASGQLVVQHVARVAADHVPDHGASERMQVAHQVEDLVADELVGEAQVVVEHDALADHDGVVERSAPRQAVLAHERHVAEEAVRPRRRQLALRRRPR